MIKVLFICHGNICRSPMAEFVFRDMVRRRGLSDQVETASAALHRDAIGCPPHRGTREKLAGAGISTAGKVAVLARREDYERYDYLIGMDEANRADMRRLFGPDPCGKIHLLLDFTSHPRDVADPWYTHDFEATWQDINAGCDALLTHILAHPAP